MKFAKFKKIIEGIKERDAWENKAYELGIDLIGIPNDPCSW